MESCNRHVKSAASKFAACLEWNYEAYIYLQRTRINCQEILDDQTRSPELVSRI